MLSRVSRLADPVTRVSFIENSRESRLILELPLDANITMPLSPAWTVLTTHFYTLLAERKRESRTLPAFFGLFPSEIRHYQSGQRAARPNGRP